MTIYKHREFQRWLEKLRDKRAQLAMVRHFERINVEGKVFGDVKPIGGKVFEMRFHFSKGYRVYFSQKGDELLLLWIGGDKNSQARDVEIAKRFAKEWFSNGEH